jgi:hypothetical protein
VAKRKSGSDIAARIGAFIGKSIGTLERRKQELTKELADVDRQIAAVRDGVIRRLGGAAAPARRAEAKAAKAVRRALSPETRAKMRAAAKRRWAAAKKAGKTRLG